MVYNGSQALAVIKQQYGNLSFAILDVNMPEMTGLEVVKSVREMVENELEKS